MFRSYKDNLVCAFSTRKGGVSKGPYESMNLSLSSGDDPASVLKNYEIWCKSLGVDYCETVMVHQVHGNNVIRVKRDNCGEGLLKACKYDADGMITNEPGVALVTSHADCTPVYLYDPKHKAIGLCHAGWRGTTLEIASKAIEKMNEAFGSSPEDIYAAIGPCISQKYFECDADVISAILNMCTYTDGTYYFDEQSNKYHVSMPILNKSVLINSGLKKENIEIDGSCTYGCAEKFFSHRRMGSERGGHAALLMLKK